MSVQHESNSTNASAGRNGPNVALIISGILIVAAVIFFLANGKSVEVNFLGFHKETTVRWSIIVAIVLGIVIDRLFGIWWRRRRRG